MVLDSKTTDILFNSSGRAFDYVAERLKEERKRLGKDLNSPMSSEEKERNVLFVFQIPLKQKEIRRTKFNSGNYFSDSYSDSCLESDMIYNQSYKITNSKSIGINYEKNSFDLFNSENVNNSSNYESNRKVLSNQSREHDIEKKSLKKIGLDNAMLRVSDKDKGSFEGTRGLTLERDFRYPIRCTLQYYWITDTEEISQEQISQIASQLETFYTNSFNKSSLIYGIDRLNLK